MRSVKSCPGCSGLIQSREHCDTPHDASHGVVVEKPRCAQEPLLLVPAQVDGAKAFNLHKPVDLISLGNGYVQGVAVIA